VITFSPGTLFFVASLVVVFLAYLMKTRQGSDIADLPKGVALIALLLAIAIAIDALAG
jgi:hypothetical protein